MKKFGFMAVAAALSFAFIACDLDNLDGSDRHREGSGSRNRGRYDAGLVTVNQAQELPHYSRLTLQGNIVSRIRSDYYLFRDETGEITVEIERRVWRNAGLSFNDIRHDDLLEISGKLERSSRRSVKMEASRITIITQVPPSGGGQEIPRGYQVRFFNVDGSLLHGGYKNLGESIHPPIFDPPVLWDSPFIGWREGIGGRLIPNAEWPLTVTGSVDFHVVLQN